MLDYVSKYTTLRKTYRIIMMELMFDGLTLINYLHILNWFIAIYEINILEKLQIHIYVNQLPLLGIELEQHLLLIQLHNCGNTYIQFQNFNHKF